MAHCILSWPIFSYSRIQSRNSVYREYLELYSMLHFVIEGAYGKQLGIDISKALPVGDVNRCCLGKNPSYLRNKSKYQKASSIIFLVIAFTKEWARFTWARFTCSLTVCRVFCRCSATVYQWNVSQVYYWSYSFKFTIHAYKYFANITIPRVTDSESAITVSETATSAILTAHAQLVRSASPDASCFTQKKSKQEMPGGDLPTFTKYSWTISNPKHCSPSDEYLSSCWPATRCGVS